ncbi:MAG: aspartate kinase [SAR202 cluster bacterium]|nr:aspartate kinase [SAR202 cluster bacterium]|tara:strand:- start:1387 stop:2607 length:1221 start_codon:yes stop_codon:yes gene_type:complete
MPILVQKYGGSSVSNATKIKNVALRIAESKKEGNQLAIVLSAMGDSTDQLIELAKSITTAPEPRELDTLLSTGELVSCTLMAMALRELGIAAISMSGAQAGIKTNTAHGRASIVDLDAARILNILNSGTIAIVAGFQGISEDMDITTLGRGGSDTTAVALAAAINAARCEVYTDVDGIYTADPRVVPKARKIKEIGYEEMLELASYGAKMHPRSIELGAWYKVPILVAASYETLPGTMIHAVNSEGNNMEITNKVSGVTYQKGIARITIRGIPDKPGIAASVFTPLSNANISVDTIVQNASAENLTDLSFTVDEKDLNTALEVTQSVALTINATECTTRNQLGQVSIVGTGMQNEPGVASTMFSTLSAAEVNIEMITTSQIRITCIIDESQIDIATRVLHQAFGLD